MNALGHYMKKALVIAWGVWHGEYDAP